MHLQTECYDLMERFYILHSYGYYKMQLRMRRFNDVDGIVKTFHEFVMSFSNVNRRYENNMALVCVRVLKKRAPWDLIVAIEIGNQVWHMRYSLVENIFRRINILPIENVDRQWKMDGEEHYLPSRWPYSIYIACLHLVALWLHSCA